MKFTIRYKSGKPFGVFSSYEEAEAYLTSHILDNPSAYGFEEEIEKKDFTVCIIHPIDFTMIPPFDFSHEKKKLKNCIIKGFLQFEQHGDYAVTVTEEVTFKPCSLVDTGENDRKIINVCPVLRVWHFNRFFHIWVSEKRIKTDYDSFIEATKEIGWKDLEKMEQAEAYRKDINARIYELEGE